MIAIWSLLTFSSKGKSKIIYIFNILLVLMNIIIHRGELTHNHLMHLTPIFLYTLNIKNQ